MSELRRDPILGQWVVVHTEDFWLPQDYEQVDNTPRKKAVCQFCPGREMMTPPEIEAIRTEGTSANQPGWRVRVVANKFPALKIEGGLEPRHLGLFELSNGIGAHEVLVETAEHEKSLSDLSQQEVWDVIKKYQSRLVDLARDRRFKYIVIFKNYGESAGATVEHAHSQIIALPMIPKYVLSELEGAEHYFHENKRCVFCDIIAQEIGEKKRIVTEDEHFVVFSPFVARYPFECWIVPKRHHCDFGALIEKEQYSLSGILKEALLRMKNCLRDPSYNYYLHTVPVNDEAFGSHSSAKDFFHWHIEIVPKLTHAAGFEWGTGFYLVRTPPELAAEYQRKA